MWFFIYGGIIIYAYWFFSYLTELGPTELKEYFNRFRKSDQGIENQNDHNYRTHIGGRKPSVPSISFMAAPHLSGARLPTVTAAQMKREGSVLNSPEIGSLFSGDEDASSPEMKTEC